MGDSLKERLQTHAAAFDGLLSLIPAKMYYGEDNSDQWKKRKQSKAEAREAKRKKLDPDSEMNRTVKEVMDERARSKRKLEDMQNDNDSASSIVGDDDVDGIAKEQPGEGLKKQTGDNQAHIKKQRLSLDENPDQKMPSKKEKAREEKRAAKKLRKEEKKKKSLGPNVEPTVSTQDGTDIPQPHEAQPSTEAHEVVEGRDGQPGSSNPTNAVDNQAEAKETSPELPDASAPPSPIFDTPSDEQAEPISTTNSTTSTTDLPEKSERPRHIVIPEDTTILRAKLAAKIEALRAQRKADGTDGKPVRTRDELIEERRRKQAQRKAHKQELRRLAKQEEDRKREEALASARNSPASMLSPLIDLDEDRGTNNFAFGRVAFTDGTQMSHDLSYLKKTDKKKGPSDPKTALMKLEAQKKRIASLDEDKRKEVLEKETWVAARKRAEGEKVRDDETLLKKAVKRKEKAKKKSEREWKDRAVGVQKSIKERQKKREENLRKRNEDKLGGRGKKKGGASKKKSRPGFEGGFGMGGKRK